MLDPGFRKKPGILLEENAITKSKLNLVVLQLMKINKMTMDETNKYLEISFLLWEQRNKNNWTVDISFIDQYLDHPKQ
jgi:hypothetical protein